MAEVARQPQPRDADDSFARRVFSKDRRAILKSLGRCINGPFEDRPGVLGVVHDIPPMRKDGTGREVRCARCKAVHTRARTGIGPLEMAAVEVADVVI